MECNEKGEAAAVRVLAAVKRDRHGRRVADLEKKDDPPEPEAGASFKIGWRTGWPPKRGGNFTSRGNKQLSRCSEF